MNASGGNNASEVIWYTQSKEHTEGERYMSASPGRKDVDEEGAVVAYCILGVYALRQQSKYLLKQVCT